MTSQRYVNASSDSSVCNVMQTDLFSDLPFLCYLVLTKSTLCIKRLMITYLPQ